MNDNAEITPAPPFLVVQTRRAFWVETQPCDQLSCTWDALREQVCEGALCIDAAGNSSRVTGVIAVSPVSLLHRLVPWRRISIELELHPHGRLTVRDVVGLLKEILHDENEFVDHLAKPVELCIQLAAATTFHDIIELTSGV